MSIAGARTAQRRRALALLAVLALSGATARAPAQTQHPPAPSAAPSTPEPELQRRKVEARERFARGLELASAERWDAALAEFMASREIYPTRVATRNAALALAQLMRFSQALALYAELLREFGAQMSLPERDEVELEMQELRDNVGELAIESAPPGSVVVIDGEQRGTTPLRSVNVDAGTHAVRVSKQGHESYEAEVVVAGRQQKTVVASLPRLRPAEARAITEAGAGRVDPSGDRRRPHLYLEVSGGLALASSFAGTAESGCDDEVEIPAELPNGGVGPACSSRSRPLGFVFSARAGYRLGAGLGLELFGGYARVAQGLTRRVRAEVDPAMREPAAFFAHDYRDRTRISGPLAGLSASYRVFERTPLLARVSLGVLRARVQSENRGDFSGALGGGVFTREVSVPEQALDAWVPFAGPELRFGYSLAARLTIDLGIAALWMIPGKAPRAGRTAQSSAEERNTVIADQNRADRFFSLPREESLGSFLLLVPSLGASVEL